MGKKHIVIKFAAILLCVGMCLAGCNGMKKTNTSSEPTPVVSYGTDWQTEGFKLESSNNAKFMDTLMTPSLMMHEIGWLELPLYHSDFAYDYHNTVSTYEGDTLYLWHNYYLKEGMGYCFQTYCAATQTGEGVEVVLPEEIRDGRARGMDVLNGQVHVIYESPTGEMCVLASADNGKNWSHLKLETADEAQSTEYPVYDFYVDSKGYFYVFSGTGQTEDFLLVYDGEGKKLFAQLLSEEPGALKTTAFHTPDGSVVLVVPRKQPDTPVLKWYNLPSKAPVELVEMDTTDRFSMTMTEDGTVYIMEYSKLVKWNPMTGEQLPLYNFLRTDMDTDKICEVGITEEGDVLLFAENDTNWGIYTLSYKEVEKPKTDLTLASIAGYHPNAYLEKQTIKYNRRKPDAVMLESNYEDGEAYRTRVMADLSAGKGPDLLWVSMDDMQMLKEKGLLADLRELIAQETLDEIFSGILESCTLEDMLCGIYFDGSPCALFVANDIWQGDTWELTDIVQLMKDREDVRKIINYDAPYHFEELVLYNLNNSSFLDLEKGESNFACQEFVEILECLKEYGGKAENFGVNSDLKVHNLVNRGEFLTYRMPIADLPNYSVFMLDYEDSVHPVNYPGEDVYPGYWSGDYFLVVNNRSEKMEQIREYLEYLLSAVSQRNAGLPVRRDVIRSNTSVDLIGMEYFGHYIMGDSTTVPLELKEDGSAYLEEYIAFLDKLGPSPRTDSKLKEIIIAGAQEYFEGKCTAERAAELIDNRVQLYLDEQK